jgi:hypothetical protein
MAYVERQTAGDGPKGAHTIRKVATIFPQEMTDEGFGRVGIPRGFKEEVLEFPAQSPQVENPVCPFHALKVDGHGVSALSEQKVRRGGVAMDQHSIILPQATSVPPLVTQEIEFPCISRAHAPFGYQ